MTETAVDCPLRRWDMPSCPHEGRIVENGVVTRWGHGWQFTYPEGSTISVGVIEE